MKKNLLIAALAIFGCATGFAQETETVTETLTPTADTYLRKGNKQDNGSKSVIEFHSTTDADFVGLMSFSVPSKSGYDITKATLVLYTQMVNGRETVSIYPFGNFNENDIYENHESSIATARAGQPIATGITLSGWNGKAMKDVTAEQAEEYGTIDAWKTEIDLTSYIPTVGEGQVNLLLTNSDGRKTTIFTKDANDGDNEIKDIKNKGIIKFEVNEVCPKLIVKYTTATGINEVETVEPVAKGKEGIYTLSGVRVAKADQPGIYIINGKKVMVGRK